MIIEEFDQLSDEWFKARGAIPTASQFSRIVTSTGAPSKQRQKYLYQLAGESILGRKEETYQNAAMLRGIELEPEARALYEVITGHEVDQVGLCYPDERKLCACSPDGLVGSDGGLEIKCPSLAVHVEYLLNNKLPVEYYQQVQGSMYITDRKFWFFFSYYPGMKPLLVRVDRDNTFCKKLEAELNQFTKELEEIKRAIA